jgi:phenylalanyl-tRNA synthetase beta chain
MLCSEKELGLSEEHEGIVILPDDAPVGVPLRDYLGDAVLEIAITPNVARALSILGVAREVAALTGQTVRMPEIVLDENGPNVTDHVRVTVENPELCPRFTATLIEGVKIGPSPLWMQRRLMMGGMRPINNIVDISNYVMLELGQPNHTFDANAVADQHLIVRLARPGEQVTTLDGKLRELTPDRLLITDSRGPLSLAGVMGGATSEVSDTTTRILLEIASWETTTIRKTAQAFKLQSEASRRFERGVDHELPPLTQRRMLGLLQQLAGEHVVVYKGMVDVYSRPWQTVVLDLPPREVTRIVGITLSAPEIADLLRPLGFGCEALETAEQGACVRVTVPSFRQDVTILADLCEEVARMHSYEQIPETLLSDVLPDQHGNPTHEVEEKVRDVLAGAGLDEAMTYSLTSMASVAKVDPAVADPRLYLRLANPQSAEREYMRRSLLPSLLEALAANLREYDRVAQFELGRVYLPRDASTSNGSPRPDEPRRLTIVMAGPRSPLAWYPRDTQPMDFFDIKGIVETLLNRLHIGDDVRFVPLTDDARFHPGRAAALVQGPEVGRQGAGNGQSVARIGVLGELHPQVRERLGLETPRALAAELDLEALTALAQPAKYRPISRYPATSQDLALVVNIDMSSDRVVAAIRKYAGALLESVALFDIYEGPQVGPGKRSLAYHLTFRAQDRTLNDAEINKVRTKIVRGLERDVGATIRG